MTDTHDTPDTPASTTRTEVIAAEPVESLAALLEVDVPYAAGDVVPPLWHWTYLLDRRRSSELGPDGHPTSGIPAPPGPGRRRMFAGGRVTTYRPLVIGEPATKVTFITRTVEKEGRTGPLTFVTVLQETTQGGDLVVLRLPKQRPQLSIFEAHVEDRAHVDARYARDWLAALAAREVGLRPVLLLRTAVLLCTFLLVTGCKKDDTSPAGGGGGAAARGRARAGYQHCYS